MKRKQWIKKNITYHFHESRFWCRNNFFLWNRALIYWKITHLGRRQLSGGVESGVSQKFRMTNKFEKHVILNPLTTHLVNQLFGSFFGELSQIWRKGPVSFWNPARQTPVNQLSTMKKGLLWSPSVKVEKLCVEKAIHTQNFSHSHTLSVTYDPLSTTHIASQLICTIRSHTVLRNWSYVSKILFTHKQNFFSLTHTLGYTWPTLIHTHSFPIDAYHTFTHCSLRNLPFAHERKKGAGPSKQHRSCCALLQSVPRGATSPAHTHKEKELVVTHTQLP